jgi:acetyl-CoA C-acetyltransferase
MLEAVIVSTARNPIGRAYKGACNNTPAPTLAAHAFRAAVAMPGVAPEFIDDCIMGAAIQQGAQSAIGRNAALRAGLPVSVPAETGARPQRLHHRRQCQPAIGWCLRQRIDGPRFRG